MPTRAHRPSVQTRTHSRSSSGTSSKLGGNLQFTQKDLPAPRVSDKGRKSALFHHEPAPRATAHIVRSTSGIRVHSRENLQPPALRRAPSPNTAAKQNGAKQKVDFTISSPGEGEDDDEWVSSESGAATPNNESDTETEQAEQPHEAEASQSDVARPAPLQRLQSTHLNATSGHDVATPKAAPTSLPRVDTARPSELPLAPTSRDYAPAEGAQRRATSSQTQADQQRPQLEIQILSPTPPVNKAHSETHSPPRRSPDIDLAHKRQSMTRPPSTHSVTSPGLRPHPLIRGLSSGGPGGFAAKPVPLAPLTTVLPDAASGEISNASSSPTSLRAASPTSIRTVSVSPNPSPSSSSPAHKQLRRASTSSTSSIATMPIPPSVSDKLSNRTSHDRQRTMSSISSTPSIAALAGFTRPTPSPPRTTMTVRFPPQPELDDSIHPLLPPPYLSSLLTLLNFRNPISESYDRVMEARRAR